MPDGQPDGHAWEPGSSRMFGSTSQVPRGAAPGRGQDRTPAPPSLEMHWTPKDINVHIRRFASDGFRSRAASTVPRSRSAVSQASPSCASATTSPVGATTIE